MQSPSARRGFALNACKLGLLAWAGLFLLWTKSALAAEIEVTTDRNPVNLYESFQIIFSVNGEPDGDPDFAPLEQDFDILSQGRSSNISVINGRYRKTNDWTLTVMAKRAGELIIPVISFGRDLSPSAFVIVKETPLSNAPDADADLLLEVEAEPKNPYVQAQVIYTIRLLRRINVSNASLSEPELGDAIIEKLGEDSSYTLQRQGRHYAVIERKYAIFPQRAGPVTIEPLVLEAEVFDGRYSRFNGFLNQHMARTRRLKSEPVHLEVRPIPAEFTGQNWLPAKRLKLTENWSKNPPRMTAGEPITRTIALRAAEVTVGQLPELAAEDQIASVSGNGVIKHYPDQPALNEQKNSAGLVGLREEKIALIASQAGDYRLPAVEIPWWNTQTEQMEIARLPARTIIASPAKINGARPSDPALAAPNPAQAGPAPAANLQSRNSQGASFWPWLSLFLAVGWVGTVIAWWLRRKGSTRESISESGSATVKAAVKAVQIACVRDDPARAKEALLRWAKAHWPKAPPRSLGEIALRTKDPVRAELQRLSRALYSQRSEAWQGKDLWQAFQSAMGDKAEAKKAQDVQLEPLYKA